MAQIRINKPEAARRQLNAAIRMLFGGEDSVAIHTLAMAGFRILRDLASEKDASNVARTIAAIIKPGKEKEFWKVMHKAANFFKHADQDPEEILVVGDLQEVNVGMLSLASKYYVDLGYQWTPEMLALGIWFMGLDLEKLSLENENSQSRAVVETAIDSIRTLPREEQLASVLEYLNHARSSGDS